MTDLAVPKSKTAVFDEYFRKSGIRIMSQTGGAFVPNSRKTVTFFIVDNLSGIEDDRRPIPLRGFVESTVGAYSYFFFAERGGNIMNWPDALDRIDELILSWIVP